MSDEWIDDIEKKLGKVVEVAKEKFPGLDPVDHPPHYTFGTIEVITVIEDWGLAFHEANVVKYIARARHKGKELEDLKKARWYLDRLIKKLDG